MRKGRAWAMVACFMGFVAWQRYVLLRLVLHVVHRAVLLAYKLRIVTPEIYTRQRSTGGSGEAVLTLPSRELCSFLLVVRSFPHSSIVQVKNWFQVQKLVCPVLRGPERVYRILGSGDGQTQVAVPREAYKVQWPGLEYLKEVHGMILFIHGNLSPTLSKSSLANTDFAAKISRMCAVPVHLSDYAMDGKVRNGILECMQYYLWLRKMYPGKKLCLVGDGIGCGVILAVLEEVIASRAPKPDGIVLMSPQLLPPLDGGMLWQEVFRERTAAQAIPTFMEASPPFYITVARDEMLYEDALHIASSVRSDGATVTLEVNNFGVHNYPMFEAYATEYAESLFRLCEFLKSIFFSEELRKEEDLEELTIGRITPRFVNFDDR